MSSQVGGSLLEPLLLLAVLAALMTLAYLLGHRARRATDSSLSALAGVGQAILSAELQVAALCEVVYQQSGKIVDTANFQLGLFDGDDYVIKVWVRDGERLAPGHFPKAASEGIVGWVRLERQGLLVRDFERERDQLPARPAYRAPSVPARSAVFVPLLAGGQAIGAMAIQSRVPHAFREEHLRLLTVLASQAAGAIQNARLFERERARTQELRLIGQVTHQLTAVQPLPNLFRQIVDLLHDTFGYYAVSVFVLEEAAGVVRLGASSHPSIHEEAATVRPGKGIVGWAAENAQVAHAPDVTQDTRYMHLVALPDTRSEVALPLMVERRVLGVLDVQSDQVGAFDQDDLYVLEALAGQLALAIQEAITYDAERRQAERLATMVEASRAVVSILNIDDLLEEVVDLVVDFFGFDRVHLFLHSGDRLVFRAGSGVHSGLWEIESLSYGLDELGLIPLAARRGEAVVSNDVRADPGYLPGPGVEDTRAEVAVPIQMGRRLLGVLDVQSLQANAFTAEDVALVQALGDTIAVALRNAALYAAEQRRHLLAETLRQVGTALTSSLDLQGVLDGILLALERAVACDTALVLLLNEQGTAYRVGAALGVPDETLDIDVPAGGDVQEEILWWLHELYDRRGTIPGSTHDCAITPLSVAGDDIGYLMVDRTGHEAFSTEDRRIVEAFAAQAAVAIANAQLFAAQQEEAWVITALLQVAEAVNSEVEIEAALQTVVRLTTLLAGVYRCGILRWDPLTRHLFGGIAYGLPPEAKPAFAALSLSADEWDFASVASLSSNAVMAGTGSPPEVPVPLGELFGPALLGIPLVAKGRLLGLMLVDHPSPGKAIDERQLSILRGIAYQTALAMEAARLQAEAGERQRLERELELARQIQRSFLPEGPPQIAGWEVAAFYRSARQVGGDFYDFFQINDGRWGFVVADVAGKGVPAALFMALSRTLIRVAAMGHTSPSETLARVNELVLADARSDLFVTAFYLILGPETGEMHYATGGHNPPVHVRADDGTAGPLDGRGLAIGVQERVEYEEHVRRLGPGDVVLLYTDGITEAVNPDGEDYGVGRLMEKVTACRERSAEEIASAVSAAVDAFAEGAPQFDDLTLVVLKRIAPQHKGQEGAGE